MKTPPVDTPMLIKQARAVERLLARRRKMAKALRDLDDEIRTARKFLQDLAMPTTEPMNHGELGTLGLNVP